MALLLIHPKGGGGGGGGGGWHGEIGPVWPYCDASLFLYSRRPLPTDF